MQGLADGYFVIPYTLAHYVAANPLQAVTTEHAGVQRGRAERAGTESIAFSRVRRSRTPRSFTASSGRLLWDDVGMSR
jgi:succinate dehydrogenase / fumarate reductase flavoprotein subunit